MENYFDYIILSEVIEHMPDTAINKNIDLIHKILKNGGEIIVTTPHENILFIKNITDITTQKIYLKIFQVKNLNCLKKNFYLKKYFY